MMKYIVLVIWILLGFQVGSILFYGDGIDVNRSFGEVERGIDGAWKRNIGAEYTTWVKYPEHLAGPFTGGFGEQSCHSCHFDYDLNMPDGVLELTGLPNTIEPGKIYELEVLIRRPDLGAAGFQLTSRFEDGSQAGSFILNHEVIFTPNTSGEASSGGVSNGAAPRGTDYSGTSKVAVEPGNNNSGVKNQSVATPRGTVSSGATPDSLISEMSGSGGKNPIGIQYLQHAVKNISPENGQKVWKFTWTAPESNAQGPIIINLAGNAANGDESAFEDWILLREYRVVVGD